MRNTCPEVKDGERGEDATETARAAGFGREPPLARDARAHLALVATAGICARLQALPSEALGTAAPPPQRLTAAGSSWSWMLATQEEDSPRRNWSRMLATQELVNPDMAILGFLVLLVLLCLGCIVYAYVVAFERRKYNSSRELLVAGAAAGDGHSSASPSPSPSPPGSPQAPHGRRRR
ncbi:unnamed protein product [Prorocentrum cordatum]|uniref:Uncharacterized protein n=1 Tax=Prorocentrum cordatum TaxID=2364126 RepID=A0ABN9QAT0_9DINO|nr:unnamed protein product [Polarella glacialis]